MTLDGWLSSTQATLGPFLHTLAQYHSGNIPFNPLRLVLLVLWVYLCLYCVQRIQFSPLIDVRHKTLAKVSTLFLGPFFIGVLVMTLALRKSKKTGVNFMELVKEYTRQLAADIHQLGGMGRSRKVTVKLLDASGRSLDEVFGHSLQKRQYHSTLQLTEKLISSALKDLASDILIDPKSPTEYSVRFRVDGVLHPIQTLTGDTCGAVVNSIKALSSMDIAEKRRPEDGAFIVRIGDLNASCRVASAGVLNGEKISIRVLNQRAGSFTLEDTGLGQKQIGVLMDLIKRPAGMILLCGPTGSGKTTTLYAMLNQIDRYTRNVITVEDPIEAVLPEASQIEINPKADITFAKTLRSILRQDPDVICVGEIRDEETAEIALRAAQTGHLVLATMHCDSNAAAIVRLMDLGISPLLIATGLQAVFSQRLLRCLCEKCKKKAVLTPAKIRDYRQRHIDISRLSEPVGCPACRDTGYLGRTAVGDLTILTEELKAKMVQGTSLVEELRSTGNKKGRSNLNKQGLRKVVSGITSFAEVKRVMG
jgi:type II secretory ATPase GspE/PulE/Tfp pilus assembly ATPase PilB-like protein